MLDWAGKQEKPILLVTDDQKEDWFRKEGSTIVGPRPELVAEMRNKADVDFYLYTFRNFLQHARSYLLAEVSERALNEVREIRIEQENQLRSRLAQRQRRLDRLLAERSAAERELVYVHTITRDLELASSRAAKLHARLEDIERELSEVQTAIGALGDRPADDDSEAAQSVRLHLESLRDRKLHLEGLRMQTRNDLASQMTEEASIRHRLSDVQSKLAQRSVRLASLEHDGRVPSSGVTASSRGSR